MSTLDKRTWIIEGEIIEADLDAQKVTVRTSHGETLTDVTVGSPSLSNKDKTGIHNFPRKGDKCWLNRDVDKWYVSTFGAAADATGKFAAKRPPLFRAGGQHIHADLSGVDILPAFTGESGAKLFATEKFGVTVEILGDGSSVISKSVTFSSTVRTFDGSAMVRDEISCESCHETLGSIPDPASKPTSLRVNVGAILLDLTLPSMSDVDVKFEGEHFDKLIDQTKSNPIDRVNLEIPDFPGTLAGVTATAVGAGPAFAGSVTVRVKRTLSGSTQTPSGTFDVILSHPTTGECVRYVAGLNLNAFSPGVSRRNLISVPAGFSVGFARQPTDLGSFGAVFTLRKEVSGILLQELEVGNALAENSKYVGVSGPFQDILGLFDSAVPPVQQDNGLLNSFRTDPLTLAEIEALPTPVLGFEITGVAATQTERDAIKSRLDGSAVNPVFVFASESPKKNFGIQISNFVATDKFRIDVFIDSDNTAPDYGTPASPVPPIIYGINPATIFAPETMFAEISCENLRYGSEYTLVQTTKLVDAGTSSEHFEPIVGTPPQLSLGRDTGDNPRDIMLLFYSGDATQFSGKVSVYRVSDKLVGMKFQISKFPSAVIPETLYGEYNLKIDGSNLDGTGAIVTSFTKAVKIMPSVSGGIEQAVTGRSSSTNVLMQKVLSRASDGTDTELFHYAVDENGRLDISAKGGVSFDGRTTSLSSSLAGQLASTSSAASVVSQVGDASLVALDGNVYIAAFRPDPNDFFSGDVVVHADGCVSIGHGSETVHVGRKARRVQVGTLSPVTQVGGHADSVLKKFPDAFKVLPPPDDPNTPLRIHPYTAVGPFLFIDESHKYNGQVSIAAANGQPPTGLSSTFIALRHRPSALANVVVEGRLNLVFVPDGRGIGTEDDPYTGTWHVPLA